MAGTFSLTALLRTGGSGGSFGSDGRRPSRARRILVRGGALAALGVIALAAAAIIPGSHTGAGPFGVRRAARTTDPADQLKIHETKVFDSNIPADRYGTIVGDQENEGLSPQGQLTSDLSPLPAGEFNRPIAAYRVYAERWSSRLAGAVTTLEAGLAGGARSTAQRDWETAFADYLHLGAVYGLLPTGLDRRIAGVPLVLGDRHFAGLHRIEMGLWTGASPGSLVPLAVALHRAIAQERRILPHVTITPLAYATRAHEILEDAQRDLLSGTQVPWSGAGVLGTAAGVAVTREVIATLVPLLQGRDETLTQVQYWLLALQHVINGLRRPDGTYPANGQLSTLARERLDGTLAGTLTALDQVPGTLETTQIPVIPSIPTATPR